MSAITAGGLDLGLPPESWTGVDTGVQALLDRWLVAEGEPVAAGQVVARAVLVKSTLDIVAPAAGVLERVFVPAGANFAREQAVGRIAKG
ncbi:MAG TPA: lipoyl domain-containing protein [Hydrogenophaga sp.]|uniref:lipoyl domain-containing protein n=1 Tax=Hydrogenophaga sp. TaxID=1904254 RepID=UPI002CCD12F1|nr:lipoyl domain-containing protein [Hydrogenophaga sp.]HSX92480.1 lipoyl domain-containing protein [Hydrogenophaga sp.]